METQMEFLPIMINGELVYAGFWKRFCAGMIDVFILLPLMVLLIWVQGYDRMLAISLVIPGSILVVIYYVFFNARFGGTPGKWAVDIRITQPDGSSIGWSEAWKRSSINLILVLIGLVVQIWALIQVDPAQYASLSSWSERAKLLGEYRPVWHSADKWMNHLWFMSETIVFFCNNRRRAIHDFIAGTVVIHKPFAK